MKMARLFFTIIGSGALTLGMGSAGEPPSQPSEQDSHAKHPASVRPADRVRGNGDQMDRRYSKSNSGRQTPDMRGPAGSFHTQSKSLPLHQLHQPELEGVATAANDGLMMNRMASHREPLAKLPAGTGTTAPWSGAVRGRGAATAVLGGAKASSAKNSTAALDGAAIKRKP